MIPDAARFAVDTAIDEALARLAARATKQGAPRQPAESD